MAHEALKFNVNLNDSQNWQPIVGCQHYGTFYMIYIKFDQLEKQKDKYYYTCSFRLQNYNGPVTMGIVGEPEIRVLDDDQLRKNEEFLRQNIPGFDEMTEEEQQNTLDIHRIDCELKIFTKPFHFNEKLLGYTLNPIKTELKGMTLNTSCEKEIPDSIYYNQAEPLKSDYLNPYHFRRIGDELLELGYKRYSIDEPFSGINNAGTLLSQCNPSRSYLL
ncbi:hypothetical protein [uncultured Aquimarina sp.]|uniref:hypothetical protein n=1 Tax=uncultured Aquimarina sp. TaxID=575652 RepID=UPI00263601F7|nr:hypothetical protein [uncultured Aquimarina sp.]